MAYSLTEKKLKLVIMGAELSTIIGVFFLVIGALSFICYIGIMIAGPEGSLYWPVRPKGFFVALSTLFELLIFFLPSGSLATLGNIFIIRKKYKPGGIISMASSIYLTILTALHPPMLPFTITGSLPLISGILSLTSARKPYKTPSK